MVSGLDRGVNFIDTADVYSRGESETLLGNALKGIREEIVLATKVRLPMSENFNRSGATRVNIMRGVESSLKRLQTDHVDLYQVHSWDSTTPLEETLRTLDDLVRQGKSALRRVQQLHVMAGGRRHRHAGRAGAGEVRHRPDVLQPRGPGPGARVPVLCAIRGHGHSRLEPSGRRLPLGQIWKRRARRQTGTRFAEAGQFVPFEKEAGYRVVGCAEGVAPGELGPIAWVLSRPAVSSVIIAARKAENLEDNIAAVDLVLSESDISASMMPRTRGALPEVDGSPTRHRGAPRPEVLNPERYAEGGPGRTCAGQNGRAEGFATGEIRESTPYLVAEEASKARGGIDQWSRRNLPLVQGVLDHWSRRILPLVAAGLTSGKFLLLSLMKYLLRNFCST